MIETSIFIETPSLDDCQPRLKSASSALERKRLYPASSQSGISCKVVDETWPSGQILQLQNIFSKNYKYFLKKRSLTTSLRIYTSYILSLNDRGCIYTSLHKKNYQDPVVRVTLNKLSAFVEKGLALCFNDC